MPSASDSEGKSILLKAASEPLMEMSMSKIAARQINSNSRLAGKVRLTVSRRLAQTVAVRKLSKIKVLTRCPIAQSGRVLVRFSAVLPVKTRPAPTAASVRMKIKEPIEAIIVQKAAEFLILRHLKIAHSNKISITRPSKAVETL